MSQFCEGEIQRMRWQWLILRKTQIQSVGRWVLGELWAGDRNSCLQLTHSWSAVSSRPHSQRIAVSLTYLNHILSTRFSSPLSTLFNRSKYRLLYESKWTLRRRLVCGSSYFRAPRLPGTFYWSCSYAVHVVTYSPMRLVAVCVWRDWGGEGMSDVALTCCSPSALGHMLITFFYNQPTGNIIFVSDITSTYTIFVKSRYTETCH